MNEKGHFFTSQVRRLENHRKKGNIRVITFNHNEKDLKESYSIKKNQKIKKKFLTPPGPPGVPQGTPISQLRGDLSKIASVRPKLMT